MSLLRHLRGYRIWGGAACFAFLIFLGFAAANIAHSTLEFPLLFAALLSGFAWVGVTSVSRHAFVNAKRAIGKEPSHSEFFMTQLAIPFYPYLYKKLEREYHAFESYREHKADGEHP